jgi:hypothetical protein
MKEQLSEFRQMHTKLQEMPEGSEKSKLAEEWKRKKLHLATVAGQLITRFEPLLALPKIKTFPWQM